MNLTVVTVRRLDQRAWVSQKINFAVVCIPYLWYNLHMAEKPLIETNPYLRDPDKFEKALVTNVASSTAIELGDLPVYIARALEKDTDLFEIIKPFAKRKKPSRSPT